MNRIVDQDFDELGARLGRALRNRVAAQPFNTPTLGPVRAGARRRRAVHRGGMVLVCVAFAAAAGLALTRRVDPRVSGNDGASPIERPGMLPAYAVLDGAPGVGEPVSMWAFRGSEPMGIALPRVDVWQSGDQRLVIRSVDNSEVPPASGVTTTAAVVTTVAATGSSQPWGDRPVTKLNVRNADGAIEELATDQFAVWIPSPSPTKYVVVIGRGISRAQVLADVESLVAVDGVLQPSAGFALVESAAALPSTTPAPAIASVIYDESSGPFVTTNSAPPGRSSIETIGSLEVGRVDLVGSREVMYIEGRLGNPPSVTWRDSTGVVTTVTTRVGSVEDLIPFVRMVAEPGFIGLSTELSARIARNVPVADQASVGNTLVIRRVDNDTSALCILIDGIESCVADTSGESPTSLVDQVEIDGHWVIFGYRQILPDEEWPLTVDDVTFTSPGGSCCTVESTKVDNAYWFVVHVDDDVDLVDTNVGNVFGGIVGTMSRPLIASAS